MVKLCEVMHEQGIQCQASKQAPDAAHGLLLLLLFVTPRNTQASELYATFALKSARKGITYALARVA